MSNKLWTKDFLLVSTTNFFLYFIHYLLIACMTTFTIETFHASTAMSGLAAGIFIIGMLFGRLVAGRFINTFGWKKMLYTGIFISFLLIVSYNWIHTMAILLLIRLLHGVGFGLASTATGTIVSQVIPDAKRGEGTGYYALSTTLAAAIGPFFSIYVTQHFAFQWNFIICLVLIVFSFIFALGIRVEEQHEGDVRQKGFHWQSYFEKKALPIALIALLIGLSYSSVLSYLNEYAQTIRLVDAASFFFLVYSVATLASRPYTGRLFDRKGENAVIYPALFSFIAGLLLLSYAQNVFILYAAAVLIGIGFGTFIASAQAVVVKISPKAHMGLATSTLYMFADFGAGFGPFIIGFIIPSVGFTVMYQLMACVACIALVMYYFVHGKKVS